MLTFYNAHHACKPGTQMFIEVGFLVSLYFVPAVVHITHHGFKKLQKNTNI